MRIGKREKLITDNRGYSLVELLVVISIMAILTGGISLSAGVIFSKDASKCATKLNDAITETKMLSMSKEYSYSLKITIKDSKYFAIISGVDGSGTEKYRNEINLEDGSKSTISSITCNAMAETISDTDPLSIIFNETKGNVLSINGNADYTEELLEFTITSKKGTESNKTSKVSLVTGTGKHLVGEL